MPFLLKFLNQIKHESALNMYAAEKSEETVSLGIAGIEESIRSATGRNGVHFGETVNIYGPSGGGKTWAIKVLSEHALEHTNGSVICFDLDGRFVAGSLVANERFHLFQANNRAQLVATVQGLDTWLYRHTDELVTMVFIDGAAQLDNSLLETLKRWQRKWSFVMVTTSMEAHINNTQYRFHVYKRYNQVEMKLMWPSSSTIEAFPVVSRTPKLG
ncbi:hypothetical protein BJV82DRAFT_124539 [Fennellomyces sp. T-0311]|nr:hypothetical protein BJV82DRAFT_124539 [Fennellomyces sp. T-0311]